MTNLKRPKLAAMLFAAVLCSMPANGETITYYNNENPDDILNSSQFEIDSYLETATLTKFQDWYYDENVVIPETFEYGGTTYTITAIGEEAFYSEYDDYDDILTLTIPETVTTIGVKAFSNLKSLEVIRLPQDLKEIASDTFTNCISLEEINFPEGLETLNKYACHNCTSLKSVSFGSKIKNISYQVFDFTCLQSISIDATTPPEIESGTLNSPNITRTELIKVHIPAGTKALYEEAWKTELEAIEFIESEGIPSGVAMESAKTLQIRSN
ncbi:MAG TPA: leucine-rich repeat domain-containing protein, partial [Candidatus Limisoma intestinavium]|nr:leucine-rich repeat domain-containing protein [Candidatus Limisoma intestinavium]